MRITGHTPETTYPRSRRLPVLGADEHALISPTLKPAFCQYLFDMPKLFVVKMT